MFDADIASRFNNFSTGWHIIMNLCAYTGLMAGLKSTFESIAKFIVRTHLPDIVRFDCSPKVLVKQHGQLFMRSTNSVIFEKLNLLLAQMVISSSVGNTMRTAELINGGV